ncbi:S9 family peptidase [Romeria aff. gracilis LEGE 07310]|uniref:S9 family peptidase n=1 Tax=Vasconcelosia minhoensis LEGE 07310 TaxID=915328 RepID=A0A8J7DEY7_9CYAN|nr:S9 family peptidase [Romeria aff. gracilis LEGE 07310]
MTANAQATWQTPPEPIASMLNTRRLPTVMFSPRSRYFVALEPSVLPPIASLAQPKIAIAGLQINPKTWEPAKANFFQAISLHRLDDSPAIPIVLPPAPRLRHLHWSFSGRYLAFTLTQAEGVELWLLDVEQAKAQPLTGPVLNAVYGTPYLWLPDDSLVYKQRPQSTPPPAPPPLPLGPLVEENLGRTAPTRTYTNLLQNPYDEALFEHYLSAQLVKIHPKDGLDSDRQPFTQTQLFRTVLPSPDGQWLLVATLHRPFSYQVPLSRFATRFEVLNLQGEVVHTVADLPLAEEIPVNFDAVRAGQRLVSWRADRAATLFWVEALDGGDANKKVPWRDAVYTLAAPFQDEPRQLWRSTLRFRGLLWGNGETAIAYSAWYNTRQLQMWRLRPDQPDSEPVLIGDRNFQDAYSHPGDPVTAPGPYGWATLLIPDADRIYLNGRGASPRGVYPFLDRLDLSSGQTERLWQSPERTFSRVRRVLDPQATELIIRSESQTSPGNFSLYNRQTDTATPLTQFADPLPWYRDVRKALVRYRRADGLDLSATLYLPPGYQADRDGPLPVLLWVYPEEHKSRDTASQVTRSEYTFSRPRGSSILFLLTQGYAILAGPTLPIVGEADEEPNDTYLEQLVAGAEAAVDYLVQRGVGKRDRVAIGGHSYGAFTTANLLAHSPLFCTGIARSGAYNRSLTPFGFQGEQRTFWDAPDTYIRLSPFMAAAQIKQPLLLIHGADDNNPGTYPMQSERLYEALKGLGGTVRWVSLPYEGHAYRSREAVGHGLWEMVQWLNIYLKR